MNIKTRLDKLEAKADPEREGRLIIWMEGEPEPEHDPDIDFVLRIVRDDGIKATAREDQADA
jgi:hypothetical protein